MKGVIVAAGYGSRFLPVTRVVPKELLPIVDRPAIDWVVEEFQQAGIDEVLVITSRRKRSIEDWFDRDPELEQLYPPERLARPSVKATFVRQAEMKGTGHALLLAKSFVGDDPFVVAFPDDLFAPAERNCSQILVDLYERTGCSVLAAGDLGRDADVSRYGVLDLHEREGVKRVRGIVEKPSPGTEPSKVVSWGRYLYTPELFRELEDGVDRPRTGEYYATEAIQALCDRDRVVAATIPQARWDTGERLGYLQTVIRVALDHPTLGEPLRAWLDEELRGGR
ncbi:MAG: UTP--glucose-1-phosphate uridylyltransferase [Alphaproteobacteria bacterium]|nr:UTP--glucose-1-phosphate uridylyltransferase [Alphaproteobacteria bacterium]MCB9697978.1 UTP--glucose-1-phosphate uridylyltransferase [Alphaproteobacteria bacterium]